jgi:hypothetical protein
MLHKASDSTAAVLTLLLVAAACAAYRGLTQRAGQTPLHQPGPKRQLCSKSINTWYTATPAAQLGRLHGANVTTLAGNSTAYASWPLKHVSACLKPATRAIPH